MKIDYTTVTELPNYKASREQLARLFHRYHFASLYCQDKEVLEVACGAGQGLGYLARVTKRVVGGDIDENNLKYAREHYRGRANIEIKFLDAHNLPFENQSFEVVILFEAIYYLSDPERFIKEAYRVLKNDGVLIIGTVNKDWSDFNPSPYSIKYFSVPELNQLLNTEVQDIEFYGIFETRPNSLPGKIISLIKREAVALNLIPKTMKGKELFKRLFFGPLISIPSEITEGLAEYQSPAPIGSDIPNYDYKVLYAVTQKKKALNNSLN